MFRTVKLPKLRLEFFFINLHLEFVKEWVTTIWQIIAKYSQLVYYYLLLLIVIKVWMIDARQTISSFLVEKENI